MTVCTLTSLTLRAFFCSLQISTICWLSVGFGGGVGGAACMAIGRARRAITIAALLLTTVQDWDWDRRRCLYLHLDRHCAPLGTGAEPLGPLPLLCSLSSWCSLLVSWCWWPRPAAWGMGHGAAAWARMGGVGPMADDRSWDQRTPAGAWAPCEADGRWPMTAKTRIRCPI
jgi:hypothetical protein